MYDTQYKPLEQQYDTITLLYHTLYKNSNVFDKSG